MKKPYAESCEENKRAILDVLASLFQQTGRVLEIGSGTGQHAVFFASEMPHLDWQPTDREENLQGIQCWLEESELENILPLTCLDVSQSAWPIEPVDYAFSANTVHIMSWSHVENLFDGLESILNRQGLFALYGPFNYNGNYSSESNARFDQWLKQRDPRSGIRDVAELDKLAERAGLRRIDDIEMPANNRILVWEKL